MQLTPTILREHSRDLRHAARNETDLKTKLACASDALLLAQLAEQLERTRGFISDHEIAQYRTGLGEILSDDQRQRIEALLRQGRSRTSGTIRLYIP